MDEGGGESSKDAENSDKTSDEMILTKMDKFKKLFYSDVEWEAYLLERIEKREKAQKGISPVKKNNLLKRLKNLFTTSQECQKFLDREREEYLQSQRKKVDTESEK
ncbi:uncharacterized protein LOC111624168 [Centruroides sculpturatus]|uniref:uncharacterized protein LOC111624168 n=1 Tax=Centruroides sculpturatus TaxID=218467 RepID=UPI000C6DB227|nr:uncharacterized protein LOC111624168 [Centruroides sculpturatus]